MPKGLKRYYGQGHLHFLTFSCYRRLPLLGTVRARNLFVKDAILAAKVLRFQRIQPRKEEGKTGVHARKSSGPRTGEASEGLAVEQFFLLCERGSRIGGD
jgi:hypothetical protein